MDIKSQITIDNLNRQQFFSGVYPHLHDTKEKLIQLNELDVSLCILVDCCSWHYKSLWPDMTIIGLETLHSIKDSKLDRSKFQGFIDDRVYNNLKWPNIELPSNKSSALIFDRSRFLKYRTVDDIINVIHTAATKYLPDCVVFNASTMFINDPRFTDRLTALSLLLIPGYVVTEFFYNTKNIKITYKKKVNL